MNCTKIILGIVLLVSVVSCSPKKAEEAPMSDSTAVSMVSSSAAVENKKDTTHKFIRTADLKFKVKSVIKSTYNIEDITARMGGFVTYTNLASNIDDTETTVVSADSSLITTHFTITNTITIRVPNTRLDTTLKEIAKNIDFLDSRVIKADDVSLQLLSNNLTLKRSARNEQRLTHAIDNRGKKLNETTNAEEVLLSKQEQADNARISNLSLRDQMNFSTINLTIYQHQAVRHELIANDQNTREYEPGLGTKIVDSLSTGWEILEAVFLFLLKLWGLYVYAAILYLGYRIYLAKFKK
ncbi:MAG: DUF4349 domain-containing protein [Paludibacter sp.]|nr:DUF4349 domain-containing protein [Paludibacter sp.]